LKQGIRWKLGRWNNISFWFDNWVDNHNLVELLSVPLDAIPEPNVVVSDFINIDRSWNATKLQQCVQDHNVLLKIKGIDIPTKEIDDSFCWGLSSSGDFTTKSTTWLAHKSHPLRNGFGKSTRCRKSKFFSGRSFTMRVLSEEGIQS